MQTLDSISQKVEDAYVKREALLKMPISVLPEKELADQFVDYFEKTGKSKSLFEKAKRYFPDGVQHHNTYVSPYPLFIKEGRGSKVFDVEGNAYLDFTMGAGAQLFGYASEHYDQVWQTLATDRFPLFHHQEELELAEKVNAFMPSVESIKFFQSGTEAVKAAIRLARASQKRDLVVKISGSYHGWMSPTIREIRQPGVGDLYMSGVPKVEANLCLTVPANDLSALQKTIRKRSRKIAAVIVELPGPESGRIPIYPDFVHEIQRLCRKHQILFILDEVVTGFRLARGGSQAVYNLQPDLTILGKVIGGGTSLSAVGGHRDLIQYFSRDVTRTVRGRAIFVGGTMAANRVSTMMGLATLQAIEKNDPYSTLDQKAQKMVDRLNSLFDSAGFPFFAYHFGSIVQIELVAWPTKFSWPRILDFQKRLSATHQHQLFLQSQGVLSLSGTRFFLSTAHTDEDLNHLVNAYQKLLELIPTK